MWLNKFLGVAENVIVEKLSDTQLMRFAANKALQQKQKLTSVMENPQQAIDNTLKSTGSMWERFEKFAAEEYKASQNKGKK